MNKDIREIYEGGFLMDEKDWHMLTILAEERNITRTARRLFFTQPSLSAKLKALEREFDCPLLVRNAKGIEFTAQGEMVLDYAHESLERLATLRQQIEASQHEVCGTLHIGCSFLIGKYILPFLIKPFLATYEHARIQLSIAMSSDIFAQVRQGKIQVGILRGEYDWPLGQKCLLQKDAICVVSAKPLNLDLLPKVPQIHRPMDKPLERAIHHWWKERYDVHPHTCLEIETQDGCLQMVCEGVGYTIASELVLKDYPQLWRERLRFHDGSYLIRRTHAYVSTVQLENPLARTFFHYLKTQEHEM